MSKLPLEQRPGFRSEPNHALVNALRELRDHHGLAGCVLITFEGERVGIQSSAATPEFGAVMRRLSDKILTAIDDGQFDPAKIMAN
jgi:hypothetical protein